jgi:hypothetical protein
MRVSATEPVRIVLSATGSNIRLTGLERTDNNMDLSSWPQIPAINQKNYYTFVTYAIPAM